MQSRTFVRSRLQDIVKHANVLASLSTLFAQLSTQTVELSVPLCFISSKQELTQMSDRFVAQRKPYASATSTDQSLTPTGRKVHAQAAHSTSTPTRKTKKVVDYYEILGVCYCIKPALLPSPWGLTVCLGYRLMMMSHKMRFEQRTGS